MTINCFLHKKRVLIFFFPGKSFPYIACEKFYCLHQKQQFSRNFNQNIGVESLTTF